MKQFLAIAVALLLACQAASAGFVIHNEDCTQYFVEFNYEANEEGAIKWIDRYLNAGPENLQILMLNNQGQTASYDSKVLRATWKNLTRGEDGIWSSAEGPLAERTSKMFDRMSGMSEAGIDVWKMWIDHARAKGVSPWISVRLNDVHGADKDNNYMSCELWKQHHEFWLGTYRGGDWFARELDYAHPEVRNMYLALIAEELERYDCDGIELDFMRFGRVFRYGHEIEDAHFLTDFVREARELCKAKAAAVGHKVGLAVRVPAAPEDAYGLGYDVETWLDEGLVDIVTPTVFFNSNWDDVPVQAWRKMIGSRALLVPGIEAGNRPYPSFSDAAYSGYFDYALANLYYARGADGIYTFNHFGDNTEMYKILASPELCAANSRRTLMSFNDTRRVGIRMGALLPIQVGAGYTDLRLNIGTKPEAGRDAQLIVASKEQFTDGILPDVRLNGVLLQPGRLPGTFGFVKSLKTIQPYRIPDGVLTTEGNVIEIRYVNGGKTVSIDWVEIYIGPRQ